jgi:predicted adenine nucleotide alpha hydrolase (AANH) superfamily ATPase
MKLLLHTCCGPCTAYPLAVLQDEGITAHGFFFNPNIHPYKEFQRRLEAMEILARRTGLELDCDREYGLKQYLRAVVFHEAERCTICYRMRLEAAAMKAREVGADGFTSTLLYSRYQKHDLIREIAEDTAVRHNIPFYYRDFREGWQEGIDRAKEMELYRQPYCGCIYSEQERYDKAARRTP